MGLISGSFGGSLMLVISELEVPVFRKRWEGVDKLALGVTGSSGKCLCVSRQEVYLLEQRTVYL